MTDRRPRRADLDDGINRAGVAADAGGAETAHQIIHAGSEPMRYLGVSNVAAVAVCKYPYSSHIGACVQPPQTAELRTLCRSDAALDYDHDEAIRHADE